jgi:flagella basal body P-ring formation protein FlgA
MRALATLAAALAATLALGGPALAGQAVTLRADTADADGVVTLGDLFDGAGQAANVPVAARQGTSVALDALAVQRVARNAGLDWPNAEGLRTIVVHAGLTGGGTSGPGSRGNVEVLTYARSLAAGEMVQPADLVWTKAAAIPSDAPSDADAVIGQVAKRPLRAGAVVQARDVGAAVVIKAGDLVTVTYEADGIALTLQGKAMGAGGVGETLPVLNTLSKKVVQTVAVGPGQAVVGPQADQFKATHSLRYAAR